MGSASVPLFEDREQRILHVLGHSQALRAALGNFACVPKTFPCRLPATDCELNSTPGSHASGRAGRQFLA